MEKISAVYQIVNEVTGDRYVGSSNNVKRRWKEHRHPSRWKNYPNNLLYKDFQKYGVEKFRFQILAPVMPEYLTQVEQEFIDMLHPMYNNFNAKGWNIERHRKTSKECYRRYYKTGKVKEYKIKYEHQLCCYNDETLTLSALRTRFHRAGVEHPTLEARKYLIGHTL